MLDKDANLVMPEGLDDPGLLIKRGGKGRLATEAGRTHLAEVAS